MDIQKALRQDVICLLASRGGWLTWDNWLWYVRPYSNTSHFCGVKYVHKWIIPYEVLLQESGMVLTM